MEEAGMHTVVVCLVTNMTATGTANQSPSPVSEGTFTEQGMTRGNQEVGGGEYVIVRAKHIRANVRWCI